MDGEGEDYSRMSAENHASDLIKKSCRNCHYLVYENGKQDGIYKCTVQFPEDVIRRLESGFGCQAAAVEVKGTKNLVPGVMTKFGFKPLGEEVDAYDHIANLRVDENGVLRFKK